LNGKFPLKSIKHEINNILFKIKTVGDILSEENSLETELKEISRILLDNVNHLSLLFENLFLLESIKLQKKEKLYLKEFSKNAPDKSIKGYPSLLSQSLKNLKSLGIEFEFSEKNVLKVYYDKHDRFKEYIMDITRYFLKLNGIVVEEEIYGKEKDFDSGR